MDNSNTDSRAAADVLWMICIQSHGYLTHSDSYALHLRLTYLCLRKAITNQGVCSALVLFFQTITL